MLEATQLPPTSSNEFSLWKVMLKALAATFGFLALFIMVTILALSLYLWKQATVFADEAGISLPHLKQTLDQGIKQPPLATAGHKNILLLGIDTIPGRGDVRPLSDTMSLISIDLHSGSIVSLPLPRDIWSPEYQTKLNALYAYGIDRYPGHPEQFPTEVIQNITQVPIHHTVVVSLDQVSQLIDIIGGVQLTVETGFVDTAFPRPDVDVTTERDPAKLYMTVEFQPGPQTLSGERALQFMRSRHSGDDEGDDVARARRQQQVMGALLRQLTNPINLKNPKMMGQVYKWYTTNFGQVISMPEAIATVKQLFPNRRNLTFSGQSLGVYPDDPDGALIHPQPAPAYLNQWVYLIREPEKLPALVYTKLGISP